MIAVVSASDADLNQNLSIYFDGYFYKVLATTTYFSARNNLSGLDQSFPLLKCGDLDATN